MLYIIFRAILNNQLKSHRINAMIYKFDAFISTLNHFWIVAMNLSDGEKTKLTPHAMEKNDPQQIENENEITREVR